MELVKPLVTEIFDFEYRDVFDWMSLFAIFALPWFPRKGQKRNFLLKMLFHAMSSRLKHRCKSSADIFEVSWVWKPRVFFITNLFRLFGRSRYGGKIVIDGIFWKNFVRVKSCGMNPWWKDCNIKLCKKLSFNIQQNQNVRLYINRKFFREFFFEKIRKIMKVFRHWLKKFWSSTESFLAMLSKYHSTSWEQNFEKHQIFQKLHVFFRICRKKKTSDLERKHFGKVVKTAFYVSSGIFEKKMLRRFFGLWAKNFRTSSKKFPSGL